MQRVRSDSIQVANHNVWAYAEVKDIGSAVGCHDDVGFGTPKPNILGVAVIAMQHYCQSTGLLHAH